MDREQIFNRLYRQVSRERPYSTLVKVEGSTFRGRIRMTALLEEYPGIGEVRFHVIKGPWAGSIWTRDARGLIWRIRRNTPFKEELSDLTPQIGHDLRMEDLTWSSVGERIRKASHMEILRDDPAVMKVRLVDGPYRDEITLDAKDLSPRAWVRWEGGDMVVRVFYQSPQHISATRMTAWVAVGIAVGITALGLWLWGKTKREDTV